MSRLDFMFLGHVAGCFVGAEYPLQDGRWPYDAYRSHGHLLWWEELMAKQKARCYYDTEGGRVSFTTRAAPGLLDLSKFQKYRFLDLSEFTHRPWAVVTPRRTCKLADILFAARSGSLPHGSIHLSDREELSIEAECWLLADEDVERDEESAPAEAVPRSFHRRGLSTEEMEMVVSWAKAEPGHSDELPPHVDHLFMLLARMRHLHPDAFPDRPSPDPPPPPSVEEDRKLYDSLGPERSDQPCSKGGCGRGAVRFSVMCRVHHWEMVTGRPCSFFD